MTPPEPPEPSARPDGPSEEFRELRAFERRAERTDDEFTGAGSIADFEEAERTHQVIPRVKPLREDEIEGLVPPAKQHYPVQLGAQFRRLRGSRELLRTFVERDLRVRYKQAVLGAFWAVGQPLIYMVLFTFVFGRVAKVGSDGLPYPIFSYCALVPWSLFSSSFTSANTSIITNAAIVRKIDLPREIFPLAAVGSSVADFAISLLILIGMLVGFGFLPTVTWLAVPLLVLILLVFTIAAALIVSLTTVYFRDTRQLVPMAMLFLMFATPVAFPLSDIIGPDGALQGWLAEAYLYLNPLAPLIDGIRGALALDTWPMWGPVTSSAVVSSLLLVLSYRWYKNHDRTFADVI